MLSVKTKLVMTVAAAAMAMSGAGVTAQAASNPSKTQNAALTTPLGITLQELPGGGRYGGRQESASADKSTPGFLPGGTGRRNEDRGFGFADARGMTIYAYDKDTTPGKSSCVAECLAAWPAVTVPAGAQASGDWTIIARDDGAKQWAFKGKPVYTFAKDADVGEAKGNGAEWHSVKLDSASLVKRPFGLETRDARTTSGYVLTNSLGLSVYAYTGKGNAPQLTCVTSVCPTRWEPVQAPNLAHPTGDFTLAARSDGRSQWAYKGKPLYTFSGDLSDGDTFGMSASKDFELALVAKTFMPDTASISYDPGRGPMIATKAGMVLYRLDTSFHTPDGHGLPGAQQGSPKVGRKMGTAACDGACLKTWKPFVAAANDVASGHWTIMARSDGSKQWAYKGFALYTYTGDKKPGERSGSDIYIVLAADDPKKVDVYKETKFGQLTVRESDSAANYWSYVEP